MRIISPIDEARFTDEKITRALIARIFTVNVASPMGQYSFVSFVSE